MRRALALVVVAGCGRIGFDPRADAGTADSIDAPTLPLCFSDDFGDGVGDGWNDDGGRWAIATGRDGPAWTDMFLTQSTFTQRIVNPLNDVVDLELDVDITSRTTGDLFVQLANQAGNTYQVYLFPVGSDATFDSIAITGAPPTHLVTTPLVLPATPGTWSHIRVVYNAGRFDVFVDGAPHLQVVDTTYSPPFDYAIGFTFGGAIDNVTLHCQ